MIESSPFIVSDGSWLAILTWMLTYLVHSTVLILGVWGFVRSGILRSSATQDTCWKVALTGGILTATIQILAGFEPVGGRYEVRTPSWTHSASIDAQESATASRPALLETPLVSDHDFEPRPPATEERERASTFLVHPNPTGNRGDRSTSGTNDRSESRSLNRGTGPEGRESLDELTVESLRTLAMGREGRGEEREDSAVSHPGSERSTPEPPLVREESETQASRALLPWPALAVSAWVALAILLAARVLWARLTLTRRLEPRRPVRRGSIWRMLTHLRRRAGVKTRVQLTKSPRIAGPIALGRREICLPHPAIDSLVADQQETLLAHELAHLVRKDPAWLFLARLIEGVFFFQPLNRLARRQMQEVAEYLCDDWAVRKTQHGLSLAKCLAEVAQWIEGNPTLELASGMADRSSTLVRRVERLLSESFDEKNVAPKWRVSFMVVVLIAIIGLVPAVSAVVGEPRTQETDVAPIVAQVIETESASAVIPGKDQGVRHASLDSNSPSFVQSAVLGPVTIDPARIVGEEPDVKPASFVLTQTAEKPVKLGVRIGEVREALAIHLGLDPKNVLLIDTVTEDSLAEASGVKRFDILVEINDETPATVERLREALTGFGEGEDFSVTLLRQGEKKRIEFELSGRRTSNRRTSKGRRRTDSKESVEERLNELRNKKRSQSGRRAREQREAELHAQREALAKARKEELQARRQAILERKEKEENARLAAKLKREEARGRRKERAEQRRLEQELMEAETRARRNSKKKHTHEAPSCCEKHAAEHEREHSHATELKREHATEHDHDHEVDVRVEQARAMAEEAARARELEIRKLHELERERYEKERAVSRELAERERAKAQQIREHARRHYEERAQRLSEEARRRAESVLHHAQQAHEEAAHRLAEQKDRARVEAETVHRHARNSYEQARAQFENALRKGHRDTERARELARRELEQALKQTERNAARSRHRAEALRGEAGRAWESAIHRYRSEIERAREELHRVLEGLHDEDELEEETEEFEEAIEEIESVLEEVEETLEEELEVEFESVEEEIEAEVAEIEEVIEEVLEEFEGSLQHEIQGVEDLAEVIEEQIATEMEEVEELLEETIEPFEEEIEEILEEAIEPELEEIAELLETSVEPLMEELEVVLENSFEGTCEASVEEIEAIVSQELTPRLAELESRIQARMGEVDADVESRIAELQPHISEIEARIQAEVSPLASELEHRIHGELAPALRELEGRLHELAGPKAESLVARLHEVEPRSRALEERLRADLEPRIHSLEGEIHSKFAPLMEELRNHLRILIEEAHRKKEDRDGREDN